MNDMGEQLKPQARKIREHTVIKVKIPCIRCMLIESEANEKIESCNQRDEIIQEERNFSYNHISENFQKDGGLQNLIN